MRCSSLYYQHTHKKKCVSLDHHKVSVSELSGNLSFVQKKKKNRNGLILMYNCYCVIDLRQLLRDDSRFTHYTSHFVTFRCVTGVVCLHLRLTEGRLL